MEFGVRDLHKQDYSYPKNLFSNDDMHYNLRSWDINIIWYLYLSGTLLLNRHQQASISTLPFCFSQFHTWAHGRRAAFLCCLNLFYFYTSLYLYIMFVYNVFQCLYHDKFISKSKYEWIMTLLHKVDIIQVDIVQNSNSNCNYSS